MAVQQSLDPAHCRPLKRPCFKHIIMPRKKTKNKKTVEHEGPFFRIGIKLKLPSLLTIRRRVSFI